MHDGSHNLAYACNAFLAKLKPAQSGLEISEALGVVDTHLELCGVSEIAPSLVGTERGTVAAITVSAYCVKEEMLLFIETGAGEEVVENVVGALSSGNGSDAAALEAVGEELSAQKSGVVCGSGIILEL